MAELMTLSFSLGAYARDPAEPQATADIVQRLRETEERFR
jgi:hypothetical protein